MYVKIVVPSRGSTYDTFSLYDCHRARIEDVDGTVMLEMESDREGGTRIRAEIIPENKYYLMNDEGKTIDHFVGRNFFPAVAR